MKYKLLLQLYLSHEEQNETAAAGEPYFLKPVRGKYLLEYTIENHQRHFKPSEIVAFVQTAQYRDPRFRTMLERYGISVRAVEPGAINREIAAYIETTELDYAVRVIGNNPFIDGEQIRDALRELRDEPYDYITFTGAPKGTTPSEILSGRIIKQAMKEERFRRYLEETKDHFIMSYFRKQAAVSTQNRECGKDEYSHLDLSVKNESDQEALRDNLGKTLQTSDLEALTRKSTAKIIMAHIEPTNQCNLDCLMCARLTRKTFGMLKFTDFKIIVDRMEHLRRVNLNGDGEPFLSKDLPEMLEYAKQKGIMTRIITNATVPLPEPRLEKILRNLDYFNISLDGATKESFETIRRNGNFERTRENIRQIARIIKDRNLRFDEYWINTVIQETNKNEILDMVEQVAELGVPALNFKLMNTNYDRGGSRLDDANRQVKDRMETQQYDDIDRIDEKIDEAVQLGKERGVRVYYEQDIERDFSYRKCGLSQKVFITYDGNVTPCCLRTEPEVFSFGNILEQEYGEIFGTPDYRDFIRGLVTGKPPALCRRCPSLETQAKRTERT